MLKSHYLLIHIILCTCPIDILISQSTLNLTAGEVESPVLQCEYSCGIIQFHHEFRGVLLDILETGPVNEGK